MIDIRYIDTSSIDSALFWEHLRMQPLQVAKDVLRYNFEKDRKLKLFGRILVEDFCQEIGFDFHWDLWKKDNNGKPYVLNGPHFNISHSGSIVVVAFSNEEIGCDIEIRDEFTPNEAVQYLHPEEQNYIFNAQDSHVAFYQVWTRKEALLKAKGVGIALGLNTTSVVPENKVEGWNIHSLNIVPGYELAVSSKCDMQKEAFQIREIEYQKLALAVKK